MGLGSRIFIVNDDQSIEKLSLARFERLFRQDPDERLSKYAGKRVKYAHVILELKNRKPVEVVWNIHGTSTCSPINHRVPELIY